MNYRPDFECDRMMLASELQKHLLTAGFKLDVLTLSSEEIYSRDIPQVPGVKLLCYTTISMGRTRALGEDAIRVLAIYVRKDGEVRSLFRTRTINRTGTIEGIAGRTIEKLRIAFGDVRVRDRAGYRCHCGAPKFDGKQKGTMFCAETCWTKS